MSIKIIEYSKKKRSKSSDRKTECFGYLWKGTEALTALTASGEGPCWLKSGLEGSCFTLCPFVPF
jgi:hypothetical protein